jgi:hypothetical protein
VTDATEGTHYFSTGESSGGRNLKAGGADLSGPSAPAANPAAPPANLTMPPTTPVVKKAGGGL